jgi:hypothetical protein
MIVYKCLGCKLEKTRKYAERVRWFIMHVFSTYACAKIVVLPYTVYCTIIMHMKIISLIKNATQQNSFRRQDQLDGKQ